MGRRSCDARTRHDQTNRWNRREDVAGQLGLRKTEKNEDEHRPRHQEQRVRANFFGFQEPRASLESCPQKCSGPRKETHKHDWEIKPERLDVPELGREVALEIVFDDEDAEEVGIAAGTEDVPGEGGEGEGRGCGGGEEGESVAPALGEDRPEKKNAARENGGGGALCAHRADAEE